MDLIDQLQHYRLEHQLTQEALAKQLGVAFTTVNRWLNRHVRPRPIQAHQVKKLIHMGAR
jgi:transcriptional regulator with XRE-family HTH domain